MKYLTITSLLIIFNLNLIAQTDSLHLVWETDSSLITVESVLFSESENILYASCINGKPTVKDSNGFITKISLEGKIIDQKWCIGLNAPKGMGIYNDKLYVTDINDLVEIDIKTGSIVKRHSINDSQFLNDIAISENGDVYISDMYTNTIHKYSNGELGIFSNAKELNYPNGLYIDENTLFIGSNNAILKANLLTDDIEVLISNTGSIDGLKQIDNNSFICSDWKSKVSIVNPEIKLIILNNENYNAADFEYIPSLNRIYIPTFFKNKVMCYELK